jgi:hypothetical protein
LRRSQKAVLVAILLSASPASAQILPPSQEEPYRPTPMPDPNAGWPWGFKHASNFTWTRTTLTGTFLRVAGAGGSRTTGGLVPGTDLFADGSLGVLALEERIGGALGGGGGGFEGEGHFEANVGIRGYVTDFAGPFLRGGFTLQTVGNDVMNLQYSALLGKAGYQYIAPPLAFEVGALGGYGAGTWSILTTQRKLDQSPLLGAYVLFAEKPTWAKLEWRHILPGGSGPLPLDELTTSGCFILIARAYGFCLDAKLLNGGIAATLTAAPSPATATYAGISFGFTAEAVRLVKPKP